MGINLLTLEREQNKLIKKLGITPLYSELNDKIVIKKGVFDVENIYMARTTEPLDGDSGWYIGDVNIPKNFDPNDKNNFEAIYVVDLLTLRQSLAKYTMLPVGYMVIVNGDELVSICDEKNKQVLSVKND
jgi:hypothetical protein